MALINIHEILAQFGEEALNNLYLGDRIGRLSTRCLLLNSRFAYHLFSSDSEFLAMT